MAIKINLQETEQELFCCSKWWGDPDLPFDMEYPLALAEEDGETFDYPLTFVCQIDCEDIAPFDPEGRLPHQGMFYVFAGLDEYLGLDSPWHNGPGEWPRKQVVVKYTKADFDAGKWKLVRACTKAPLPTSATRAERS